MSNPRPACSLVQVVYKLTTCPYFDKLKFETFLIQVVHCATLSCLYCMLGDIQCLLTLLVENFVVSDFYPFSIGTELAHQNVQ